MDSTNGSNRAFPCFPLFHAYEMRRMFSFWPRCGLRQLQATAAATVRPSLPLLHANYRGPL